MSITPLSAARITGELGLAGGTITGGAYAAKYSSQVTVVAEERDKAKEEKKQTETQNNEQTETRKSKAEQFKSGVQQNYNTLEVFWTQLKNTYVQQINSSYKSEIDKSLKALEGLIKSYDPQK